MTTPRQAAAEPDTTEAAVPDGQLSRRQWVRGAAIASTVVAAGVGLAACGTSSPQSTGPAPGTTPGAVPETTSSAARGTAPATTTGTTAPATPDTAAITTDETLPSLVVAKVSTIPVGGGTIYPKRGVVVTQPTAGTYKCFSSSCTHLGCTVNTVAAGVIVCPCHGAKFSIADGSVKAGPAQRPLPAQQFTIRDGGIVLD